MAPAWGTSGQLLLSTVWVDARCIIGSCKTNETIKYKSMRHNNACVRGFMRDPVCIACMRQLLLFGTHVHTHTRKHTHTHSHTHTGSSWVGSPVILIKPDNPFHQQHSGGGSSSSGGLSRQRRQNKRAGSRRDVRERTSRMR